MMPEPMNDDDIEEAREYARRIISSGGHGFDISEVPAALVALAQDFLDLIARVDELKAKVLEYEESA
jgi:hypothetical protein